MGACRQTDDSDLELDVDDWFNAEKPATFDGLDWRHGSKIVHVRPREFHAHHNAAGWPGDVRVLAQDAVIGSPLALSCTTPGAVCAVETNADQVVGRDPQAIGVAAILVQATVSRTSDAAATPRLGYGLAGGVPVTAAPGKALVGSAVQATAILFSQQAGSVDPLPPILPLELQIVKGADAAVNTGAEPLGAGRGAGPLQRL